MRSFDYRCPKGIALLVCKQLESKRDLKQAFGRVARYDDEVAPRCILDDLRGNLFNEKFQANMNQALNLLT